MSDQYDQAMAECQAARKAASKTIQLGRRKVKRFLAMGAKDDGTLRCISCGQIDEEPWHERALCPALVHFRAMARDQSQ